MDEYSPPSPCYSRGSVLFITLTAAALLFFLSAQANTDMLGFFKRYDVHLSPSVNGRLTFEGKPVAGVKVFRELTYVKEYLDSTSTADDGSFSFPVKNIRSSRPGNGLLQTKKRQILYADYQGERYVLWYTTSWNIDQQRTISMKLNDLKCELTSPKKNYSLPNHEHPDFPHAVVGICKLD